ncbi:serine/threonine-protein kinase pim-2-like isoform X3 [Girardinichthys multiradiatus]|nr:serine/threonine-protein kinase pim-2-like isoform X3 [Girardinichthys multiradiatus]XP_047205402.1 serine/threonine-protein kinase pim-2-like isoform X3 [Girardinichthys multiradiatus]
MTHQSPEFVKHSRPKKRKIAEDEIPRKGTRVSEVAGPSNSCQDPIKMVRRANRKKNKGEGPSPLARKKESSSSTVDIITESNSSRPELHSTETRDLRKRNLKRKAEDLEEPLSKKKKKTMTEKEKVDYQRANFQEKYIELHQLGEGGFGSVFAGYRVKDKLPVAIKHVQIDKVVLKHEDENGREMALELAVMLKLRTMGQPSMVFLLDWYNLEQELILVMERPMPSDDLSCYVLEHRGPLSEKEAKIILKQLVEAAIHLENANVFHRDIKVDNILIETSSEGPRAYLIDFGLSCFDYQNQHELLCGVPETMPLDWFVCNSYTAGPTTVWQLGVVMFEILHKMLFSTTSYLSNNLQINKRLSKSKPNTFHISHSTYKSVLHHPVLLLWLFSSLLFAL